MTLHPQERDIRPGTLGHGDPAQYDYLTIKSFLANVKPTDLEGLQQAYTTLQNALQDLEQRLGQHTKRLNQIWDGDAQQSDTAEIKQLAENTAAIAKASGQFGTAMSSGAAALRNPPPIPAPTGPAAVVPGLLGEAAASPADTKAAREALAKTNTSLASAFDQIPAGLTIGLPKSTWENPPGGGGAGSGAPGGASGALGPGPGALAAGPASGGGSGGQAGLSPLKTAPFHGSGPQAIGRPSGGPAPSLPAPAQSGSPTDLAGTKPELGSAPALPLNPPSINTPNHGGPASPGQGWASTPVENHPSPSSGGNAPPNPLSAPRVVSGSPRVPQYAEPELGEGRPALGSSNRLSPRGVIGGNSLRGLGGVNQEPLGPYSAGGSGRSPSGGELRNGVLRTGGDNPAMPIAEGRQGNMGAGVPMTGGVGTGNRNGERARDVYLAEDDALWEDDTDVSPRVLGKDDAARRNS